MKAYMNGFPISAGFHSVDSAHLFPHKGIDWACPPGTPVQSIGEGVVKYVMDEGAISFGKSVWVQMDDGTTAIFGHLSGFAVRQGERIHANQIIAYSGNSGDSTGSHLHLQVMKGGVAVDPANFINHHGILDFFRNGIYNTNQFGKVGGPSVVEQLWNLIVPAIDGVAILVAMIAALLGMMGWRKGWQIVYWDAGIYMIVKLFMGVS